MRSGLTEFEGQRIVYLLKFDCLLITLGLGLLVDSLLMLPCDQETSVDLIMSIALCRGVSNAGLTFLSCKTAKTDW